MQYELSNGVKVDLYGNTHTAKFLLFVYPRLHVTFVGEVPHMTVNDDVKKLIKIRDRLTENRIKILAREKERREIANLYQFASSEFEDNFDVKDFFSDDIPF